MSSSTNPKPPTTAGATTGAGANSRPVTTTTGTTTPTRPQPQPQMPHLYSIPHHAFHLYPPTSLRPPLNPNPNPNPRTNHPTPIQQGIPYPVVSSGRGFVTRSLRPPDPSFASRAPAAGIAYRPAPGSHPAQIVVDPAFAHLHQLPLRGHQYAYPVRVVRQVVADPHSPVARQHPVPSAGRVTAGSGLLVKAVPSPSLIQNSNGFRSSSDGSREDKLVTISGRKVRIVEGASLYALCRSWVRNGQPEDCQPQEGDTSKPLPRPLPLAMVEDQFPSTKGGEDIKEDEDEELVADLSPEDLLKRHIKRAKKVRARLREERLKRIARYKTRLALLLPPQVEQYQNDTAAGD